MSVRTRVGDVFQIPIDEHRVVCGQVVAKYHSVYFIVLFKSTYLRDQLPELATIVADEINLAAETVDAKIWAGLWPVVGLVKPDLSRIHMPKYRESHGGIWFVHSFDDRHREASSQEVARLPLRVSRGPQTLEDAVKAANGVGAWSQTYEALDYQLLEAQADIQI